MIRARGLARRFGARCAVDDVSLDVADGTLLALLGPNGAGKTTTVRMLSGLLSPSAGTASVAGYDVTADPAAVRARIGLVTDVPGLYEQMSPRAYLDFFGRLYGLDLATRSSRIDSLLEMFDLDSRRRDRIVTLSRGMQQKVALARALLHEPEVVFLDEPTAGLDPLAARAVRDLILSLKHARRSIVLCTHDLDEAERLADLVAIMQSGRILALDTPGALRELASPETRVRVTLAPPFPASAPGGVVEFVTAEPSAANPAVVADLVAEGGRVVSVTCTTRTLEDVYATAVTGELSPLSLARANGQVDADHVEPPTPSTALSAPNDVTALWLIARRAAVESLNDRLTRLMNVLFALVAPVALVGLVIRPMSTLASGLLADQLPFYLLVIGMMPAVGAVGIAAGQFAGERERGVLTPMLASPASNVAIFGGKVLGSILPPLAYSSIAVTIYLVGLRLVLGPAGLGMLPVGLSAAMLLLVPTVTCLAAVIGTLVSSRVRTYNAAQQVAGILMIPVWAGLFALAFRLDEWGNAGLIAAVGGVLVADVLLVIVAARTWRREEVLSQR
ncbi:MAG: ATP-binding cassette domain-containing protein [Chloroflexi bacterium]|nr:ATP-binding cassette domain-containing protein [Chloroflexota bacterium]